MLCPLAPAMPLTMAEAWVARHPAMSPEPGATASNNSAGPETRETPPDAPVSDGVSRPEVP